MRRALFTLVVAIAALAAAVPLGMAATSGSDERGDVFGSPPGGSAGADIVSASARRSSNGQVTHTITTAGTPADPAGDGVIPVVYVESPTEGNGTAECSHFVGRYRGRLGVFRCGYADRTGSARIVRSGNSLRYTFSPRAIGNPRSYDWAAVTRGNSGERGTPTRYDRLPSVDDLYLQLRVR